MPASRIGYPGEASRLRFRACLFVDHMFCARNRRSAASLNRRLPLRTFGPWLVLVHHNSYGQRKARNYSSGRWATIVAATLSATGHFRTAVARPEYLSRSGGLQAAFPTHRSASAANPEGNPQSPAAAHRVSCRAVRGNPSTLRCRARRPSRCGRQPHRC